jgi:small-conductance mechanosensitive channel
MNPSVFLSALYQWAIGTGLKILVILLVTAVVFRIVRGITNKMSALFAKQHIDDESKKRAATLGSVVRNILNVLIAIVSLMMILGQLGVEIGPVLAAAGIVGLAVGFGAQSLVKDVINGFFIFLEDQIRVGDFIEVGGHSGAVEKVNLKIIILRDIAGNVHYIPNGCVDIVTNKTKGFSRYVFEIGVAYREDVDEVIEVMKAVDEKLRSDPNFRDDIMNPLEVLGLDEFADSAVVIKARSMTKPGRQWAVGREFNRRLKKAFDEKGIEIPYPHLTLYMGQDKSGGAPPIRVRKADA